MPTCFLDCEFTDFLHPELLSLGLVELDGAEHYVELDLSTEVGQRRRAASSDFVRNGGVLDLFGLLPAAKATAWEMGRRTGEWLLQRARESGDKVEVCFDYMTDWELMEDAIRDAGIWPQVREVVLPLNVDKVTGTLEGELAAEECFRDLAKRGLMRHHALADALALRAAYIAVKDHAARATRAFHSPAFRSLVAFAEANGLTIFGEGQLRLWVMRPAYALNGRRPVDLLDEPGGLELLQDTIGRIERGAR